MNWLQSILYGFVSGLTEFLPISSQAHQMLFRTMSGSGASNPLFQLLVHIGCLIAVISCFKPARELFHRDRRNLKTKRNHTTSNALDFRVVKNAAAPLVIGFIVIRLSGIISDDLLTLAILLIVNGIVLFIPERMLHGNKDSRAMSVLDSIMMGGMGMLSAMPGISGIGCTSSMAIVRGADRQHALKWSLLLSIYALAAMCVLDIGSIFSQGADPFRFANFLLALLSGCAAYTGGYVSIQLIRFLTVKTGLSGFAYYSWGAALFSFILFLTGV